MAKPILELISDLQAAVSAAQASQTKRDAALTAYQSRYSKAKSIFDAEVGVAKADLDAATQTFDGDTAKVDALQKEVSSVLGTFSKSRVTVSR